MLINKKNSFVRSPTLDTVLMIEDVIKEFDGELNKTQLWKKLPKKVMWQTYLVVLDYLESINKIGFDKDEIIIYLWNPKLNKIIEKRKKYNFKK